MSETTTGLRALGIEHPACVVCHHDHRLTTRRYSISVTYDQACPCGCVASGRVYDSGTPAALVEPAVVVVCAHHHLPGPCARNDPDYRTRRAAHDGACDESGDTPGQSGNIRPGSDSDGPDDYRATCDPCAHDGCSCGFGGPARVRSLLRPIRLLLHHLAGVTR